MELQMTNDNFAADYQKIKEAFMRDPILNARYRDPVKPWDNWVDMDKDKIDDVTNYLLSQLIFNQFITSTTKIIPFINDEHPLKVGISLYLDEQVIYRTHKAQNDNGALFISIDDLIQAFDEIIDSFDNNPMGFEVNHILYEIAHKLGFVWELQRHQRKKL